MKAKAIQKIEAIELRRQGHSIPEIAKIVGVNQGSVSRWCKDIKLTQQQVDTLIEHSRANKANLIMGEINRNNRIKNQKEQQTRGLQDIGVINERELFLIGAALYLAEGAKTGRSLIFANSDPEVIGVFIKWLTTCCKVEFKKIKLQMHIHEDLKEEEQKQFWMDKLGVKKEQFYKTQIKKNPIKGYRKKIEYHGTLQVRVLESNLFYYIEGLMQSIRNLSP